MVLPSCGRRHRIIVTAMLAVLLMLNTVSCEPIAGTVAQNPSGTYRNPLSPRAPLCFYPTGYATTETSYLVGVTYRQVDYWLGKLSSPTCIDQGSGHHSPQRWKSQRRWQPMA